MMRGGGINKKAFIQITDISDLDSLLAEVQRLDSDDNAYLAILAEPLFLDSSHKETFDKKLEQFLYTIFSKPCHMAYRRSKTSLGAFEEKRYGRYTRILDFLRRYTPKSLLRFLKKI